MGYNHVFSVGQKVDQMGKMSKQHDWKNYQEKVQEGCMPFYYYSRSSILEMFFKQRSKTIGEEESKWVAKGGEEKERDFEKEVHKKKTFEPCTYFS